MDDLLGQVKVKNLYETKYGYQNSIMGYVTIYNI